MNIFAWFQKADDVPLVVESQYERESREAWERWNKILDDREIRGRVRHSSFTYPGIGANE